MERAFVNRYTENCVINFDQASTCRLRINGSGIVQSCTCRTEPLSTNRQIRIDSLEASVCLGEEFFCKEHAEPAERNGRRRQQDQSLDISLWRIMD
jgi:hypothetical protein